MPALRITLDLTEEELRKLAYAARGYYREEPRKGWKSAEYKEAARIAAQQIVAKYLLWKNG